MSAKDDELLSEEELIREFTEDSDDTENNSIEELTELSKTEENVDDNFESSDKNHADETAGSIDLEELPDEHDDIIDSEPELEETNEITEPAVEQNLPNPEHTETDTDETVEEACIRVLKENQHGDYTVPTLGLYPHQWLWDSCFTAIGLAEYDVERAKKELISLLRGQWANGMLPHMIFSEKDVHKRDKNLWQSWRSPHAPEYITTSGVTQPPMLAEAVWQVGQKIPLSERRSWYQVMFPAIVSYHEWIYSERDPHDGGLALLIHPYECGLDNTPPWINQLHQHHKPWWISLIETLKADKLGTLFRRDTRRIPPGQRISNIEALMYYNVIRRLRGKNWDTEKILARSHFVVQDLTFNSILLKAGVRLKDIAKTIGRPLPDSLLDSMAKGKESLDKLWDGYSSQYYSRNFITHRLIKEASIATLMPLYSGAISKDRAAQLVEHLKNSRLFKAEFPVPSVPLDSDWYSELGYWQGPSWINTNWLIAEGLDHYGYKEEARNIRKASVDLVEKHGPYEYFSAKSGNPAGAQNFSWTASLTLTMMKKR